MHFTISCDTCTMRDSHACSDCIVPMLCGESPDGAIVFDIDEMRTINVMAKVGLVPTLRHHVDERVERSVERRVDEPVTRRAGRHG
jgi:hypothetical protein